MSTICPLKVCCVPTNCLLNVYYMPTPTPTPTTITTTTATTSFMTTKCLLYVH